MVKVPGIGVRINGAERWIVAGPLTLQPSEFAKLAMVVFCAAVLTARKRPPRSIKELVNPVGAVALVVCGLVALEPDLGTTIAIAVMVTGVLIVAGTPFRLLVGTAAIVSAGAALVISQNAYMHARLLAFMHPWQDAGGSGYQNVQALLSLGSGGIWGKGLGQGTVKNGYLPEAPSDMIAAVIGEELGLIGILVTVARVRRLRRARLPGRHAHARPLRQVPRHRDHLPGHRPGGREPRRRARLPAPHGRPAAADKLRRIEPDRVPHPDRDAPERRRRRAGQRPQKAVPADDTAAKPQTAPAAAREC